MNQIKNSKKPIGSYENIAHEYSAVVDTKPIHTYYERPGTWALLPKNLSGLKILDIGCGSGWYAQQLSNAGAKVTAIDASQTMVELTSKRVQDSNPPVKCFTANLEEPLTFAQNHEFDIVLAPLVIHYVKEWQPLFKEIARILTPGGIFVFSTGQPHAQYQRSKLDNYFAAQLITERWKEPDIEVKFYHHSLHDLTESLYNAGFLIERMTEPQPQGGLKQNLQMYEQIKKEPWFLFVRAILQNA